MPSPPPAEPTAFTIPLPLAQHLQRLGEELQVPPEVVIETAVVLLETILGYNRKGYSKAVLKHAIFRNANRDIVIDIPAAADYYHQKLERERELARSLNRHLTELEVDVEAAESSSSRAGGGSALDAKLVDLTIKVEAIAEALGLLLGDEQAPEDRAASRRRAESLLAESDHAAMPGFLSEPAAEEEDDDETPVAPLDIPEAATPLGLDPFAPPDRAPRAETPAPRSRRMQDPPALY